MRLCAIFTNSGRSGRVGKGVWNVINHCTSYYRHLTKSRSAWHWCLLHTIGTGTQQAALTSQCLQPAAFLYHQTHDVLLEAAIKLDITDKVQSAWFVSAATPFTNSLTASYPTCTVRSGVEFAINIGVCFWTLSKRLIKQTQNSLTASYPTCNYVGEPPTTFTKIPWSFVKSLPWKPLIWDSFPVLNLP